MQHIDTVLKTMGQTFHLLKFKVCFTINYCTEHIFKENSLWRNKHPTSRGDISKNSLYNLSQICTVSYVADVCIRKCILAGNLPFKEEWAYTSLNTEKVIYVWPEDGDTSFSVLWATRQFWGYCSFLERLNCNVKLTSRCLVGIIKKNCSLQFRSRDDSKIWPLDL